MPMTCQKYGLFRVFMNGSSPAAEAYLCCHSGWAASCGYTSNPCPVYYYTPLSHELKFIDITKIVGEKVDARNAVSIQGPGDNIRNVILEAFDKKQWEWAMKAWKSSSGSRDIAFLTWDAQTNLASFFHDAAWNNNFPYSKLHFICCRSGEFPQHEGSWDFLNGLFPKPAPVQALDLQKLLDLADEAMK